MKKAMLTIIMAIAVTGLLALAASPAMAGVVYFGSSQDQGFDFDSGDMQNLMNAANSGALDAEGVLVDPEPESYPDDGGGEGYYREPESYPDDGGGESYDSSAGAPPADDGGLDEPVLPQNPGSSGNPTTPETPKTPPQSSSKLPNTGTQMAIFAAIGLMVIFGAYAVRRATGRRTR